MTTNSQITIYEKGRLYYIYAFAVVVVFLDFLVKVSLLVRKPSQPQRIIIRAEGDFRKDIYS